MVSFLEKKKGNNTEVLKVDIASSAFISMQALLFEKELQKCDAGAAYRDCYRARSDGEIRALSLVRRPLS